MRLIAEAVAAGARQSAACQVAGISERTLQRWRKDPKKDDGRLGPKTEPANKLSERERREVIAICSEPRFCDLSPKQIVPILAEEGRYVASEATFQRVLREKGLNAHRGVKRAKQGTRASKPTALHATAPGQVWVWDITSLPTPVKGCFFYLYLVLDVWSRMIVSARVEAVERSDLSTKHILAAMETERPSSSLALHQDNGSPMKGTLKACLESLGVFMSYSRPGQCSDNAFAESCFGTMKTRPEYPDRPFESLEHAQAWVDRFVSWHNESHRHSSIGYVTPGQRHRGEAAAVQAKRIETYKAARRRRPERWAGRQSRSWNLPKLVVVNPESQQSGAPEAGRIAA